MLRRRRPRRESVRGALQARSHQAEEIGLVASTVKVVSPCQVANLYRLPTYYTLRLVTVAVTPFGLKIVY